MDSKLAVQDVYGVMSYMSTKGTQSPHVLANFGLKYINKGFFANGAVHYTGRSLSPLQATREFLVMSPIRCHLGIISSHFTTPSPLRSV